MDNLFHEKLDILINAYQEFISDVYECVKELCYPILDTVLNAWRTYHFEQTALTWAQTTYPRLYHYAIYAKRRRIRQKYIEQIVKLYRNELQKEENQ